MKKLQKSLSLVLIFALLFSFSTMALSGSYTTADGNFGYNIKTPYAKVMEYLGSDTDVVIPAAITHSRVNFPVTEIDYRAFSDPGATVTSLQCPDSLIRIPDDLLLGFSELKSVDVGGAKEIGATAFLSCTGLQDVQWNQVETIGGEAFAECAALKEVNLPDTVTHIGASAFRDCVGLETLSFGSGVKTVPAAAFYECTALKTVYLGKNTTAVNDTAFQGCFKSDGDLYAYDKLTSFPASALDEFAGTVHCYPDSYMADLATTQGWNVQFYTAQDVYLKVDKPLIVHPSEEPQAVPTKGVQIMETYTDTDSIVPDRDVTAEAVIPEQLVFDTEGTVTITVTYKGYTLSYDVTVTTEHDYQAVVKLPTCTAKGYTTYTCSVCGDTYRGDVTNEHTATLMVLPAREATCTQAGLTEGSKCTVCNRVLVAQKTVAIKPHTPVTIPGYASTCIEKGKTDGSQCSVCGKVLVAQKDRSLASHTPAVTLTGKQATCTEPGLSEEKKCSVCGLVLQEQEETAALGHTGTWYTDQPATCDEDGIASRVCTRCGVREENVTPASGHNYVTSTVGATCTEQGYTLKRCTRCGINTKSDYVEALGHNLEGFIITKNATCTEDGARVGYCSRCHIGEEVVILATGHMEKTAAAQPATCTEPGLSEGKVCSVCGFVLSTQDTIPPLGHKYNSTVTKDPNCTEKGVLTYTCSACHDTYTEELATNGVHHFGAWTYVDEDNHERVCTFCQTEKETAKHNYEEDLQQYIAPTYTQSGKRVYVCAACGDSYEETLGATVCEHNWGEGVTTTPATCLQTGTKTYTCSICEQTKTETVSALGHKYDSVVTKEPNCTEKGVLTYTCSRCGDTYTEELSTNGEHSFGAWVYADEDNHERICSICHTEKETVAHHYVEDPKQYVAPTFTQGGKKVYICDTCGHSYDETLDPTNCDHSWGEGAVTTEATCLKDGVKTFTCAICSQTRAEVISAKGHTEVIVPGKEATCTEPGLTDGKKCSVCNEVLLAQETISAKGHTEVTVPGKEATCTATGLTEGKKCSVCKEVLLAQDTISAKGHTEVTVPGKEATCTEAGLTDGKKCSVCNEVLVAQKTISVKAHTYDAQVVEPTETAAGYTLYTCRVCGYSYKDHLTNPAPTIEIQSFVQERKLDYKRSLQFTAIVDHPVDGAEIHWFVDGKDAGKGETYIVKEAKKSYTIAAKYMKDGKVLDETGTEKVNVNTGFFAKLKAFFQGLFKKLPVLVQEYVGMEKTI